MWRPASLSGWRAAAPRRITVVLRLVCYNPGQVKMNIKDLEEDGSLVKTLGFSDMTV